MASRLMRLSVVVAFLWQFLGFAGTTAVGQNLEAFDAPSSNFHIYQGQTVSVNLDGWHYVQKIIVQARSLNFAASQVQVWSNGDVKGTLNLPGTDPSYVVTIASSVRSIEFQAVQNSAWIQAIKIVGERLRDPYFDDDLDPNGVFSPKPYVRSEVASLALHSIRLIDRLERYTNYQDYGAYLLPIKKAAARAYSLSQAAGSLSLELRDSIIGLIAQIEYAKNYIDEAYEISAAFELAVELKTTQERLRRTLL